MDEFEVAARKVQVIRATLTSEAMWQYAVFSNVLLTFIGSLKQESSKVDMLFFYGDVQQKVYDLCALAVVSDAFVAFE